ncbi:MAG: hypothetical protein ACRCW9_01840 [Cetobacterium sp.]
MKKLNKQQFMSIVDVADSVYCVQNTLFMLVNDKTYVGRNINEKAIEYAVKTFTARLSDDIANSLNKSDEQEKNVKKFYKELSIQHIANILNISTYKVSNIISRLVTNGDITRKKRYKTEWGDFIKENYKTMSRKQLAAHTGISRSAIDRAVKRLINEEEHNDGC